MNVSPSLLERENERSGNEPFARGEEEILNPESEFWLAIAILGLVVLYGWVVQPRRRG